MSLERCVICGQPSQNPEDNLFLNNGHCTAKPNLLERQSSAVFILRKLLDLPLKSLEKCFTISGGEDPASWITICEGQCQEFVENAQTAYREMCRARQKLMEYQKEIRVKMRSSSALPLSNASPNKDSKAQIFTMIRECVTNRNDITTEESETDFDTGDQMANQLLTLKQGVLHQGQPCLLLVPPVKPKQETETSLYFEDGTQDENCSDSSAAEDIKPDVDAIQPTLSRRESENTATKRILVTVKRKMKCSQCDYWGTNKAVWKHTSLVHPKVDVVFQCDQCPESFNTRGRLTKHRWNHHMPRKTLTCPHANCDYSTIQGTGHLNSHIKAKHEKPNKCSVKHCGKICESQKDLRDHQVYSHGREVDWFQCSECEYLCGKKKNLADHLLAKHGKGTPESHVCSECNMKFLTKRRLGYHIYNVHKPNRKKLKTGTNAENIAA